MISIYNGVLLSHKKWMKKFSTCNNKDVATTWTILESTGGVSVSKSCPTFVTPWTVACQAPLSMEFSRQEYWSGLPFPSSGDLPDPGIKSRSSVLQVVSSIAGRFFFFFTNWAIREVLREYYTKWNKSDRWRQILYGITYMWKLKNTAN